MSRKSHRSLTNFLWAQDFLRTIFSICKNDSFHIEVYLGPCQTSMKELFGEVDNGF